MLQRVLPGSVGLVLSLLHDNRVAFRLQFIGNVSRAATTLLFILQS